MAPQRGKPRRSPSSYLGSLDIHIRSCAPKRLKKAANDGDLQELESSPAAIRGSTIEAPSRPLSSFLPTKWPSFAISLNRLKRGVNKTNASKKPMTTEVTEPQGAVENELKQLMSAMDDSVLADATWDASKAILRPYRGSHEDQEAVSGSSCRTVPDRPAGTPGRATIQDLPPELLCEIFAAYLKEQDYSKGPDPRPGIFPWDGATVTPFHLTHICGVWRDLVHSTTRFWSDIRINIPRPCDLRLLGLWLQHTGTQPLNLSARLHGATELNRQAMSSIMHLSRRWKTLQLFVQPDVQDICSKASWNTPEHLGIFVIDFGGYYWARNAVDQFASFLYSSPNLRIGCCLNSQYHATGLESSLWTRLTHIHFQTVEMSRLLGALPNCPQLELLQLDACINDLWPGRDVVAIEVPSLKALNLQRHNTSGLVRHLTLPALKRLRLSSGFFTPSPFHRVQSGLDDPCTLLLALLERSQCFVDWFMLIHCEECGDVSLDNEIILKVLRCKQFAKLRELAISPYVDDAIPQALTATAGPILLPELIDVDFRNCRTSKDLVRKMFVSLCKRTVPVRLEGVKVKFAAEGETDVFWGHVDIKAVSCSPDTYEV